MSQKASIIGGLIVTLLMVQEAVATNNCNINFFSSDENNWYSSSYGFIEGLYDTIPVNCPRCDKFAKNMQGVNKGYVDIVLKRNTWINKNNVLSGNAFTVLARLITLFDMFYSFYINLDSVFNDAVVMSIPNRMVTMLASTEY